MPIYGYRCAACGHQKDVLQKLSDSPLTECPSCGAASFSKEVSAPAFQLKGTGWYVTDFRDGNKGGKDDGKSGDPKSADAASGSTAESGGDSTDKAGAKSKGSADAPADGAAKKPAPAPAPAAGGQTSSKS